MAAGTGRKLRPVPSSFLISKGPTTCLRAYVAERIVLAHARIHRPPRAAHPAHRRAPGPHPGTPRDGGRGAVDRGDFIEPRAGGRVLERCGSAAILSLLRGNAGRGQASVRRGQGAGGRRFRGHRLPDRQGKERKAAMAERKLKIWYDREGDYLEVIFDQREGFFRETANDQVMEKVDAQGRILGFSVLKVSALT